MSEQLYIDWYGRHLSMTFDLRRLDFGKFNFIMLMARRISERRRWSQKPAVVVAEAKACFYDFLDQSGIDFGDADYVWTPSSAFEVADEYLAYD